MIKAVLDRVKIWPGVLQFFYLEHCDVIIMLRKQHYSPNKPFNLSWDKIANIVMNTK